MWPVRNVYNAASTQSWIAMACLHGGDSMNEDFADCAKFHRRVKSALALGKYHDWEHFRSFEGEINERLCEFKNLGHGYIF